MDLIYPSVLLSSGLLYNVWARVSGHRVCHFALTTVALAEEIYMACSFLPLGLWD